VNGWESFLIAEVGASAALTGLIFVGVSINLSRILSLPRLPSRALEALMLLLTVLIVSSLMLIPGQSSAWIGGELLVIGLIVWIIFVKIDTDNWRKTDVPYRRTASLLIVINQLSIVPYIIASALVLLNGFAGLYWMAVAVLFSFVKAIVDAWVLLVEINR